MGGTATGRAGATGATVVLGRCFNGLVNATGPPDARTAAERERRVGGPHETSDEQLARAESGADGREDSPHRAPARRATVIGVDTHDTVTHESPMSDRLRRPCALSPPAPVGAHVTIHTRRMTKRMHAL